MPRWPWSIKIAFEWFPSRSFSPPLQRISFNQVFCRHDAKTTKEKSSLALIRFPASFWSLYFAKVKKKVAYQDIIFTFQGIESVFHKSSLLFNNQSSLLTINQVGSQTAYHLNLRGIKSIYKENVVVNHFLAVKSIMNWMICMLTAPSYFVLLFIRQHGRAFSQCFTAYLGSGIWAGILFCFERPRPVRRRHLHYSRRGGWPCRTESPEHGTGARQRVGRRL